MGKKNLGADLIPGIFLKEFEDLLRLRCGEIGPHPHVEHDRLPLGRRELGGVAFRVAAVAIDGVQLGAGEFLWRRFPVRFLFRFGVCQNRAEAQAGQRQCAGQNHQSVVDECWAHKSSTFFCYLP